MDASVPAASGKSDKEELGGISDDAGEVGERHGLEDGKMKARPQGFFVVNGGKETKVHQGLC